MSKGSSDSDFTDGLEHVLPKHSKPLRQEFQPWHLPRKQWVREYQWAHSVEQLIQTGRITFTDNRPLRYLTLPGEDLLDIRVLHECCERIGRPLKFLGFDSSRSFDLHVSEHEIASLPKIHGESFVRSEELSAIGIKDSHAGRALEAFGGIDVVNMDLCNSIARDALGSMESSFNSIARIIDHQSNTRTEPWLLYLTTRANLKSSNVDVLEQFANAVLLNAKNAVFKKELSSRMQLPIESVHRLKTDQHKIPQREFVRLFYVGLSKWLLQLAQSGSPKWRLAVGSVCSYRVYGHVPDMLSLTYRFDPVRIAVSDKTNILPKSIACPKESAPTETTMALDMLKAFARLQDIDDVLRKDGKLYTKLLAKSEKLLKLARFDTDAYRAWAMQKDSARKH